MEKIPTTIEVFINLSLANSHGKEYSFSSIVEISLETSKPTWDHVFKEAVSICKEHLVKNYSLDPNSLKTMVHAFNPLLPLESYCSLYES